jgi:hypothetical protein
MHIIELDLTPAAIASLRAADLIYVDELVAHPAKNLIQMRFGPHELFEIACRLNEHDLSFPTGYGRQPRKLPDDRDRELFRLRVVEGLTLDDAGAAVGISRDRVRQLMRERYGLTGTIPTGSARRWAATQRRRLEDQPSEGGRRDAI